MTGLSGSTLTPQQLTGRTVLVILYIAWSMLGVAAVALFLSTLTDSPLAAALGALAVLVTSQVLVTLDAASSVKQYLPTRYWLAWVDFFRDPILWHDIRRGVLVQGVVRRRVPGGWPGRRSRPGRHQLSGCRARHAGQLRGTDGAAVVSASSTSACTAGSVGSSPWATRRPGQISCTARLRAPSSEALVGRGDDLVVGGPDGHPQRTRRRLVAAVEPAEQRAVRRELLAGRRARAGASTAARPATSVPCCGDPSVTTRRAVPAPSPSATHSRATTPPAE